MSEERRQAAIRSLVPTWEPKIVDKDKDRRQALIESLREEPVKEVIDPQQKKQVKQTLQQLQAEAESKMKRRIVIDYFN